MIAGATPLAATPLGAMPPGAPAASEQANARTDETAKREFAAVLASMMQPATAAIVPRTVRIALESIADSMVASEAAPVEDEEAATVAFAGTGEELAASSLPAAPLEARVPGTTDVEAVRAAAAARTVVADTDVLDPEFSDRLTRVLDRMRKAGHKVEVRETVRSTERQEALYAQGRTTPGPVVTWTLDSRHLEGRAADVRVDGRASGKGYELLQRIAKEEGLRTLGARDPGHLELPRTTVDAREGAAARRGTSEFEVRPLRQGGMLAMPAQVARVAQVAETARVATPGMATQGTRVRAAQVAAAQSSAAMQGGIRAGTMHPEAANSVRVSASTVNSGFVPQRGAFAPGAGTTADPMLATVPVDGTLNGTVPGTLDADRGTSGAPRDGSRETAPNTTTDTPVRSFGDSTRDSARDTAGDGARDSARDGARDGARDSARNSAAYGDDERLTERQGARSAAIARSVRDARVAESEAARPARSTRGRALGGLAAAALETPARSAFESTRETMPMHAARAAAGTAGPVLMSGTLAAERVAELLAARDARPAGTIGELRLAMDPQRDGLSEVRLALQNGALDATLRTGDAGIARGLQSEVATLTRSLERQGFDAARVSVQLDAAQQARAQALDTVAASEATARERALRGDSDASREGRDQHTADDARRDLQRDQQHARQFGSRRPHPF